MDREGIYSRVFEMFTEIADFKTSGRRLKHWADVDRDRQPAIFGAQAGEIATRRKGFPTQWTLTVRLYLYVSAPNDDAPIGPVMNPILDRITRLVSQKPTGNPATPWRDLLDGETNDLGIPGVSHCWIEGAIETDEGALGSQGVAIIPINILTV